MPPVPFDPFMDQHFRKPNGEPFSPRTKKRIAERLGIPVYKEGWAKITDDVIGLKAIADAMGLEEPRPGRRRARNK
jgi:hypothetical protein